MTPSPRRTYALLFLSAAIVVARGLWLGVSAVAPQIAKESRLDETAAWLTLAGQLGFVAIR